MKTILITGAGHTGVTGRFIKEYFSASPYHLLTPSSLELDLTDERAVSDYFSCHTIDYLVHCATYRANISKNDHLVDEILESNLRMFFNLARHSDKYDKMVYLGSGAEFDKSKDIVDIREDDFPRGIPKDKYGLGKYIMNHYCLKSENIYNFRLFGTLNPYERYTKNVVSNLCVKAIMHLPLNLKKDCRFSFVDIDDVCRLLMLVLEGEPTYHAYNVVMDEKYLLSDIAKMVGQYAPNSNVSFEFSGLNREYTASNRRIKDEFKITFKPIQKSIEQIYHYWLEHQDLISIDNIDGRWK